MRSRRDLLALAAVAVAVLAGASTAGAGWSSAAETGPQAISAGSLAAPASVSPAVTCVRRTSISVQLTWPTVETASAYEVRRSTTSGGPYAPVGSTAAAAFTDTTAGEQATYFYVVVATRGAWSSAPSPEAAVTTPKLANCA